MTAQVPDILVHRGMTLDLCDDPLAAYLDRLPKSRRPDFVGLSSACWRGYQASWETREDNLFLTALSGFVRRDGETIEVDLAAAMPWMQKPRRASWVSGQMRCPEGRLIRYVHGDCLSIYERDRLIEFDRGRLTDEILRINPPLAACYRIGANGMRRLLDPEDPSGPALSDPCPPERMPTWSDFRDRPMFEDDDEGYAIGAQIVGFSDGR